MMPTPTTLRTSVADIACPEGSLAKIKDGVFQLIVGGDHETPIAARKGMGHVEILRCTPVAHRLKIRRRPIVPHALGVIL